MCLPGCCLAPNGLPDNIGTIGLAFLTVTLSSSSSSPSPSWCVSVCVRVWVRIVTRTRTQTPANHKDDDDDDEDAEEDGFGFEVSLVSSCTSRSQEPAGHAADALCSSKRPWFIFLL